VQDVDVRNRVGGTRVLDDQVVDLLVLALVETNSEVRLGQGAEVVADFGVLACHVDEHRAERQLLDELVLVGFQDAHETEVLGRDFRVEVALQDGVRHLVAKDEKTASVDAKQTLGTTLDVFDNALVAFVEDNQYGVNPLEIRHFCCWFLREELLQSAIQSPVSEIG